MLLLSYDDAAWPDFIGFKDAIRALTARDEPLEAVSERIVAVEKAGFNSVGVSGIPDARGVVTLDAGVMSGTDLLAAGVGCLIGYESSFLVAKEIWHRQKEKNFSHNLLVGEGAALLAEEIGARRVPVEARALASAAPKSQTHDTVGCIALGQQKDGWFVGTSTSGLGGKTPGRVGDASGCGAGFYATRDGAVFCTGTGEVATRLALAARVATHIEEGASPGQAVAAGLAKVAGLKNGFLGPVIVHVASLRGCAVAGYGFPEGEPIPATYSFWREGMAEPVRRAVPTWQPWNKVAEF